ncbi:MAG TPA: hypothetical protein VKQ72_08900 [Aggregatilineales bacterium]|nr:hypothetical protein [Aggregatilineales bacterium]
MKRYLLRLYPELPLCVDDATVIPATALRGALAEALLASCVQSHQHDTGPCSPNCRYWTLFGEGTESRIGPAYAGSGDDTFPLLATARTCSRVPGFKGAGGHGVFDVAIREYVFEVAATHPERILSPYNPACPVCVMPVVPWTGIAVKRAEREFTMLGNVATPVVSHHAAFSRVRRQPVRDYAINAKLVQGGTRYTARLLLPDQAEATLRQAISSGLWIGANRHRGYGALRAELLPDEHVPEDIRERIKAFNRAIRAERRFYSAMTGGTAALSSASLDEGEWYFTLDMSVPALVDLAAGPSMIPALSALPSVEVVRAWIAPRVEGGWHAAAGLPRRTQPGVSGVALYRVSAESNRAAVDEVLAFLEDSGIGMARERGYGAIKICDPLHLWIEAV